MNREIKFRIWNLDAEQWYEPVFEAYKGLLFELLLTTSGELCERSMQGFTHESRFPGKYVIQQYTGLKDKNGKEIYEGDIVKANCSKSGEDRRHRKYHTCTIYWEMHGYHLTIHHKGEQWATGWSNWTTEQEWEVIGNIYDNPELIK